jgi:outer membrane lipoprotein-sorting protein
MPKLLIQTVVLPFSLFLFPLVSNLPAAEKPTVKQLVHLMDDLYRSSGSSGHLELTAKTETQDRHLKMRIWTKGQDKALIVIDEPAREAGTATLKVGNNLWNYLPKISRTIRIPPSMMLSPWMGTDFTNDDLVKDTSYANDFTTKITGRSQDPHGWLAVMEVKPGVVGRWQKIEWVVNDEGTLPLLGRYYDRKGRLARVMKFDEVKELGGRAIPTHLSLESVDQPGHQTDIRYLDMQFNLNLPDSVFSLSQLERQ